MTNEELMLIMVSICTGILVGNLVGNLVSMIADLIIDFRQKRKVKKDEDTIH